MVGIEDFHYVLLPENIEGTPREIRLGRRDLSRMLVIDRAACTQIHSMVCELPRWISKGDVLILNNSKRIPGVLKGRTAVGGLVELRFVDIEGEQAGLCRIFPMHDIKLGSVIALQGGGSIKVIELGVTKYELARVQAENDSLRQFLRSQGLPISGFFYEGHWTAGQLNPYFASEEGSVESPLAGLHFTPELVRELESAGIEVCFITLHSVGSWLPFLEKRVVEHKMWPEYFSIPDATAAAIRRARARGGKVFACGSTSLRALEAGATQGREVAAMSGRTDLYITPGYEFRVVDAYFTNFHQYQTSLIVLDAAFGGGEIVMNAYREASKLHYSFYEFGDAVLYI